MEVRNGTRGKLQDAKDTAREWNLNDNGDESVKERHKLREEKITHEYKISQRIMDDKKY